MLSSTPLDPARHILADFDSGEPGVDEWLTSHAHGSDARGITRTFVWTGADTAAVIGYYTLMAHVLQRESLPRALSHGSPHEIPAVLLARLGLDKRAQGRGLGGGLLGDAAERAWIASQNVGARFLVVDALHTKAASFYEHHGFKRIPGTLRLLQKMSAIAAAIRNADEPLTGP